MRLPYIQVQHEDSRRLGAELAVLDEGKRAPRWWRGLLEDLWAWGLSLDGDRRPTGVLDHPSAAARMAAVLEWSDGVERLVELLLTVGLVERTKRGGLRVCGIVDRYGRAWDRQQQQLDASAKGVKARKKRPTGSGEPPPNGATGSGATKTETETETETDHRSSTDVDEAPPPLHETTAVPERPPLTPARPPVTLPDNKFASAEDFWRWAQFKRGQVGFIPEKPPHPAKLAAWWTEVHLELRGDPSRLEPAFYEFAKDKHWETRAPPLPFAGFMSAWRNFAPAQRPA